MDKENIVYIQHGVMVSHKNKCNFVIGRKMDGTGDHHFEQDMSSTKVQISRFHSFVEFRPKIMVTMGYECKRSTAWGGISRSGWGKETILKDEVDSNTHAHMNIA
jgi:hypothetical protein